MRNQVLTEEENGWICIGKTYVNTPKKPDYREFGPVFCENPYCIECRKKHEIYIEVTLAEWLRRAPAITSSVCSS
jgi:hypothetical protein